MATKFDIVERVWLGSAVHQSFLGGRPELLHSLAAVLVVVKPHLGIFPSEVIGTGLLILLGDGVVAAVLLALSLIHI